jgi:protein TonB
MNTWRQRIVIGAALLALVAAALWGVRHLGHGPETPKRQMARIMILPDTPPPLPPPPEDKKPPPPKEQQTQQQASVPKQVVTPEPQQLKMEGQAGEGPSAFAAGDVKQDYIGGDVGNGSRYGAYVARLEQLIQVELTKHKLRVDNVKIFLWLLPDGSIQRFTVAGGDDGAERSVRAALAELTRFDEAPLADMPMPVGMQISAR